MNYSFLCVIFTHIDTNVKNTAVLQLMGSLRPLKFKETEPLGYSTLKGMKMVKLVMTSAGEKHILIQPGSGGDDIPVQVQIIQYTSYSTPMRISNFH